MKYCSKCGAEIFDEAVVCVKCGCLTQEQANPIYAQPVHGQPNETTPQPIVVPYPAQSVPVRRNGNATAIKVFLILGTILMAIYTFCIALAWCLPMTLSYCKKIKRGETIGTGFKVCTLLFVSLLGGILMLCDNNDKTA